MNEITSYASSPSYATFYDEEKGCVESPKREFKIIKKVEWCSEPSGNHYSSYLRITEEEGKQPYIYCSGTKTPLFTEISTDRLVQMIVEMTESESDENSSSELKDRIKTLIKTYRNEL